MRWRRLVVSVLVAISGAIICLLIGLQTGFVQSWLTDYLADLIGTFMTEGSVDIGEIRFSGLSGLQISNVVVRDDEGRSHLAVDALAMDWRPQELLWGEAQVNRLEIDGVVVNLTQNEEGSIELLGLFSSGDSASSSSDFSWALDQFLFRDVDVRWQSTSGQLTEVHVDGLAGEASGSGADWLVRNLEMNGELRGEDGFEWSVETTASVSQGALTLEHLRGTTPFGRLLVRGSASAEQRLDLVVSLEELDPEWFGQAPEMLSAQFLVQGPLDWLHLEGNVAGANSDLGHLLVDASFALSDSSDLWKVRLDTQDLKIGSLLGLDEDEVSIGAQLHVHGEGYGWPDALSAEFYSILDKPLQVGDQQLAAMEIQGHLNQGRLELSSIDTSVEAMGSVRGFADFDLVGGAVLAKLQGDIVPSQFGLGGSGRIVSTIEGNAYDPPLDVEAHVDLTSPSFGDRLRARSLVAAVESSFSDERLQFNGRASGRQIDAYGVIIDNMALDSLAGSVSANDTSVQWKGVLSGLHYGRDVHGTFVQSEGRFELVDSQTNLEMFGSIGTLKAYGFPVSNGAYRLNQDGDSGSFVLEMLDNGRTVVSTELSVDLKDRHVQIPKLDLAPTARVRWSNEGPISFSLRDEGLSNIAASMGSPQGKLSIRGDLDPAQPLDAVAHLQGFSLDVLAELFPDSVESISGDTSLELRLSGEAENPLMSAFIKSKKLHIPGVIQELDLTISSDFRDGLFWADAQASHGDNVIVESKFSVPVSLRWSEFAVSPDAPLTGHIHIPPVSFESVRPLFPSLSTFPNGVANGYLTLGGSLEAPGLVGNGVAEIDVPKIRNTARVEWEVKHLEENLSLNSWGYIGNEEQVSARVSAPSRFGEAILSLVGLEKAPEEVLGGISVDGTLTDVKVIDLMALAEVNLPLNGSVNGVFSSQGPLLQPAVSCELSWDDGRIGHETFDSFLLRLEPARGGNSIAMAWDFNADAGIRIDGDIPLAIDLRRPPDSWFEEGMALEVSGPGLPLGALSVLDSGITNGRGLLSVWGALGGSLLEPKGVLTVRSKGAELEYLPLNLRFEQIKLRAELNDREFILDELSAQTVASREWLANVVDENTSVVKMAGTVGLDGLVAVQIRLKEALLAASHDLRLRLDGGVNVRGTWPELSVEGSPGLDLVQGKVILDATAFVDQSSLSLDSRIRTHRGGAVAANEASARESESSWMDQMSVYLPISLNRNLETEVTMPFVEDMGGIGAMVSSMDLKARLGSVQSGEGQLVFTMEKGELLLTGDIDVLEGKISVLKTRFNLTEGALRYAGGAAFEPALDIAGESASSYDLSVRLTGTPTHPEINLSSETYPDTAEQMTILLTGRPPDELSEQNGKFTASTLAEMLLNSVFSNIDIGSLSVEPDGSIRVGVPLSDSVYAESLLDLQPELDDNRVTLFLEWTMLPRLLMLTALGEQKSGIDLFWEYRF